MEDLLRMDVLQPNDQLDKILPDFFLCDRTGELTPDIMVQVPAVTVLHDDVEQVALDEGTLVTDDIGVLQLVEDGDLR